MRRASLLLFLVCTARAERYPFLISQAGEVVATLEMSSPGSDWAVAGREAAVASVRVDNRAQQHVVLCTGKPHRYSILLGSLDAGTHELAVENDPQYAAVHSGFHVTGAQFRTIVPSDKQYALYANMPYLFARKDTIGKFSDVPLLAYCERLRENGEDVLQYTVVFSNEDGGTSTRALMARWGRTTDIEYLYRVVVDDNGRPRKAVVQGPSHQELEYQGRYDGSHALLMPVTKNNMVGEASDSPLAFHLAPVLLNLAGMAREELMYREPFTYRIAAKELQREHKLRLFGEVAGENISDPRNYIYIEYGATHQSSAFTVAIQLKNGKAYASDLGRLDYSIFRDGWVQTTVELPPGTTPTQIAAIEFRCQVAPPSTAAKPLAHSGTCHLDGVRKVFQLTEDYEPSPSFWNTGKAGAVPTGQSVVFRF